MGPSLGEFGGLGAGDYAGLFIAIAAVMHVSILSGCADKCRDTARMSEQAGNLVVRVSSGVSLMGEALGKLTTIALVLLLELHEIAHPDATVATDTVEVDLA